MMSRSSARRSNSIRKFSTRWPASMRSTPSDRSKSPIAMANSMPNCPGRGDFRSSPNPIPSSLPRPKRPRRHSSRMKRAKSRGLSFTKTAVMSRQRKYRRRRNRYGAASGSSRVDRMARGCRVRIGSGRAQHPETARCPDILGQPRLGLVQGQHSRSSSAPIADIQTTYYYRWELVTKHLTYGSPNSGYSFTEFIDRPFWSGAYGAISCPAGHQLYEVRWLRNPRYARDYARYWFRTPGAQPRRYSTWLADAVWAVHLVHPDDGFRQRPARRPGEELRGLGEGALRARGRPVLADRPRRRHGVSTSTAGRRRTSSAVRPAIARRSTLHVGRRPGHRPHRRPRRRQEDRRGVPRRRPSRSKQNMQKKLWDPEAAVLLPHVPAATRRRDGFKVKALTPDLPDRPVRRQPARPRSDRLCPVAVQSARRGKGYEAAWKFLMDKDDFFADFGPTTVERHDPLFKISKTLLLVERQSWPYATTQTLKAMANLLQNYKQDVDHQGRLSEIAASLREDAPQERQAVHRRGVQPRHRLVGRARLATTTASIIFTPGSMTLSSPGSSA